MSLKKQHILLLIQDQNHLTIALEHSFTLARIFKAELAIAAAPSAKNYAPSSIESIVKKKSKQCGIGYQIFEFTNSKTEPNDSIQQLDAILMLTQFTPKSLKKFKRDAIYSWILTAKIPSIVLTDHTHTNDLYKNIIVPVNYRKESKEKMIWASYFGRFNKAIIHLVTAKEKYEPYVRSIKAMLIFTKKMFEAFSFDYQIVKTQRKSKDITTEALKISKSLNSDLLILMTNRNYGWLDAHFGPAQLKQILRNEKNPVLFINPLKDYYLPCS